MKRAEANKIVREHILWSMGAGLVPIPMFDLAAVTAVQVSMLQKLAELYEVDSSEVNLTTLVSALSGTTFAKIGSSLIKAIPGVGSLIGGVSMSVTSGASTYAVGEVAIAHLEATGSFMHIDMDAAKQAYNDAFEKGKAVAQELKAEKDGSNGMATKTADVASATVEGEEDILSTLEKLADLRERGVLTEEEFVAQKQRLLARL